MGFSIAIAPQISLKSIDCGYVKNPSWSSYNLVSHTDDIQITKILQRKAKNNGETCAIGFNKRCQ
jgi:hypothetical protein